MQEFLFQLSCRHLVLLFTQNKVYHTLSGQILTTNLELLFLSLHILF